MASFLKSSAPKLEKFELRTSPGKRPVDVWLVYSAKAKRLKLKVRHNGRVELVIPKGIPATQARKFVEAEAGWITKTLKTVEIPVYFEVGASIPVLGKDHLICHVDRGPRPVWQQEGRLTVSGRIEHLPRRVRDWLKKEARQKLLQEAEQFSQKSGLSFGRLTVRDQKSRWGSCSATGNLNFSWRLILMPEAALRYVVAHEVAHLKHMDHSPEFWGFVASLYPEFEQSRQWMKKNAGKYHKYDATI